MPAWLLMALVKFALPIVISWLRQDGHINAAEALVAKGAVAVVRDVKLDPAYPKGKNGV